MLIDTHAHLFFPNFENDLDEVLKRAEENNIQKIIIPSTDIKTAYQVISLIEKYDMLYGAVGVHPHDSSNWNENDLEILSELADHPKVVAIGETGLDYYYDYSPKEMQKKAFRDQLLLALDKDLPIVVHNREADTDIINIIREFKGSILKAQFHCYSGNAEDAAELVSLGHYISFTGNITFKKFDALRDVVKSTDIDRILIETDAPFMTPVPHRGKRNEPSFVTFTNKQIAEIKNMPIEEVAKITTNNAHKLFGLGESEKTDYTYPLYNGLYVNITNRCNASCYFCDRNGEAKLKGFNLKMQKKDEPNAEVYIKEIGDPKKYEEIVFCGYGEPTIRWGVIKEISVFVKKNGGKTRLNTNGHGNIINKRDITPEMKGLIDIISISLNSMDPAQYGNIMGLNETFFQEMIDFAQKSKNYVDKVVMSIVSLDEVESEKARKFVVEELGLEFRIRPYF